MNTYQKIKSIAEERGTSICAIEKGAGIGNGAIRIWDGGNPGVRNLKKVAEFLNVPITDLIEDEGEEPVRRNIERYGLRGE